MPIYEYRCQECRRISSFLLLNLSDPFFPVCKQCGSHSLERVLSRVHVRLSEETRLERLADPSAWAGVDENDPQERRQSSQKDGPGDGRGLPRGGG